jgi:hypothetical protein
LFQRFHDYVRSIFGGCTRKAQETVNPSRNTPGSTQMNEVDYKTKTMKTTLITLIALITLLLAAAAPAQESIQDQLDRIEQAQRDAAGAYGVDQIQRQSEADAWRSFRECVNEGILSQSDCAHIWLPGK